LRETAVPRRNARVLSPCATRSAPPPSDSHRGWHVHRGHVTAMLLGARPAERGCRESLLCSLPLTDSLNLILRKFKVLNGTLVHEVVFRHPFGHGRGP
jgi:hypothetical protein